VSPATARLLQAIERLTDALERTAAVAGDTVDVKGAATILKITERAVYVRNQRGKMPPTVPGNGKRLLWRRADLLRGDG
jgi:DNA replicative helicase MCM subunit Mcm2 (Cdc46/Mcm family)